MAISDLSEPGERLEIKRSSSRLKALTTLSLRKSPDQKSPLYQQWHDWRKDEIFTPPEHMDVKRALERGIVKEVKGDG